jgi:DNA-binding transcriptional ArsR family regulator
MEMSDDMCRRAVSDPALVRLLSSPVRQEIVDTLATLGGEAGVAGLAEQLGLPADGLYYHLRALVAGGLVEEILGHKGAERRYRLAGEGATAIRLAYDLGADGNSAELRSFAQAMLQIAGRDFEQALAGGDAVVAGAKRELWASRNKGWLSSADLAEVNVLLNRLSALTGQPKAAGREHLASLAFVLAPVNARPKRRTRQSAEEST